MGITDVSRRDLLKGGGAGWLGLSALQLAGPAKVFGQASGEVIPWLDQPPPSPFPESVGNLLRWEAVDAWLTPAQNFFFVNHYGQPTLSEATWRLNVTGLVERPLSLTLADLRGRARQEVDFTMECSGNTGTGLDFFIGGIGNARWAGAPLASVLEQAGIKDEATEVIFWGADRGTVTIADNPGIVSPGSTGTGTADSDGGTDLTITEQFARSMSVREALHRDNLLCYEMNGERLPVEHGFPVRLIAPGWYGVANVKWLTRIEVTDQRFTGRFMARDYVTVREQQRDGETVWTFANVGRDRLKSAPAKVTRTGGRYSIMGAAWGAPIKAVEVQIHDGPWLPTTLDDQPYQSGRKARRYAWTFWRFDWGSPRSGEHRIRSRAIDVDGNVQPAPTDAFLTSRRTYWENNGQIARMVRIP